MIKATTTQGKNGMVRVNTKMRGSVDELITETEVIIGNIDKMMQAKIKDPDERMGGRMEFIHRIQMEARKILDSCAEEMGANTISLMEDELKQKILESIQAKEDEDTEE